MTYEQKIDKIVSDCDDIIIETLKQYDTRDLEEIIKGLVINHTFTSKDSIQGLIYELEKLKDIYMKMEGVNMKINKKQMEILENHFNIYEDEKDYELETWTDGGVNMFIYIGKDIEEDLIEQLEKYVENFDIDEEIGLHRQDKRYRDDFRITESVKDFVSWVEHIKTIIKDLKGED